MHWSYVKYAGLLADIGCLCMIVPATLRNSKGMPRLQRLSLVSSFALMFVAQGIWFCWPSHVMLCIWLISIILFYIAGWTYFRQTLTKERVPSHNA